MLTVSTLMNQQYVLNAMPLSRNAHKTRFFSIDWLMKILSPQAHRNLTLFLLGAMVLVFTNSGFPETL